MKSHAMPKYEFQRATIYGEQCFSSMLALDLLLLDRCDIAILNRNTFYFGAMLPLYASDYEYFFSLVFFFESSWDGAVRRNVMLK